MFEKKTAIIIFSRSSREEVKFKTPFGKNFSKNVRLFSALNKRIRRIVAKTGLSYFVVDDSLQIGKNFKEKYENAFQSIFNKGFDNVICVGNDSPQISSDLLLDISGKLCTNELVFGKTKQGGIYTLALTRQGFNNFDFDALPWQTNQLSRALSNLCYKHFKRSCLLLDEQFQELNSANDISNFIQFIKADRKALFAFASLMEILLFVCFNTNNELKKPIQIYPENELRRGPPFELAA